MTGIKTKTKIETTIERVIAEIDEQGRLAGVEPGDEDQFPTISPNQRMDDLQNLFQAFTCTRTTDKRLSNLAMLKLLAYGTRWLANQS
jgi:hypothetical protein